MGGSEKVRQQGTGRTEGREGGGEDGWEGAGPPPTTQGLEGRGGNGGGLGGWEPGAP